MDPITPTITGTLPISYYISLFQPFPEMIADGGGGLPTIVPSGTISTMLTVIAPVVATLMSITIPNGIFAMYVSMRIGLLGLLIVWGYVMRRLGRPLSSEPVVNFSYPTGEVNAQGERQWRNVRGVEVPDFRLSTRERRRRR